MSDNKNRLWSLNTMLLGSVVFFAGVILRGIQFLLIWPVLGDLPPLDRLNLTSMQLLPAEVLVQKPLYAFVYLQQAPPVPNIIQAVVAAIFPTNDARGEIMIMLQGTIGAATAALFALMLVEFRLPKWRAAAVALIFLASTDLLLIEYHDFGYLLHENLSMLLCTLLAWICTKFSKIPTSQTAVAIGVVAALLALTRATFSYVGIPTLLWLGLVVWGNKNKIRYIGACLLPLLLLQGGWALKNFVVYNYWSVTTSTWSGLNLLHGVRARNGAAFDDWIVTQSPVCDAPYNDAAKKIIPLFGFAPRWQIVEHLPDSVSRRDGQIAERLGQFWDLNTVATQQWSECEKQQIFLYWKNHPQLLISGFFRSWRVFWLPIRQFAMDFSLPLTMEGPHYSDDSFHFGDRIVDAIWHPKFDVALTSYLWTAQQQSFSTLVVPVVPAVFSALCGLLLHSLPMLLLTTRLLRKRMSLNMGHVFLLGLVAYVAGLTSVVECCENMRFRLAVEPVIWCLGMDILRRWWDLASTTIHLQKMRLAACRSA